MISSGGGTSTSVTSKSSLSGGRGRREQFRPGCRHDERLLTVEGADTFLPDVSGQSQHHSRLQVVLGGRSREGVGYEGEVEPEPQAAGDRYGRWRNPGGVVDVQEVGERRADTAGG